MNLRLHQTLRLAAGLAVFFVGEMFGAPALVSVGPPGAVTPSLGPEFDTDGDFEGWSAADGISGALVSGGSLSGTSSSDSPKLQITNIANGPDLDLAFNDYLEIRMQLPAAYSGGFEVHFGVTDAGVAAQTGFSAERVVTVSNADIPTDGAFHTYRIDLGPVPMWRGILNDLRIVPATVSGTAFAIDFIRVGDDASEVYQRNTMDFADNGAYELSSKRFRFLWNADRETNFGMNAAWARKNLRNAEEAWQVYVKQYGYNEPAESIDPAKRSLYPGKWKTNFLCWYEGNWMTGSANSFGYMNMPPGSLRADPPSWVIPHELMHVFQMHQGGAFTGNTPMGKWWEAHANYGREIWLRAMNRHFDADPFAWSGLASSFISSSSLFHTHGTHYYDSWPIFQYVDENPDNLPDLGMATAANGNAYSARLWQESINLEYIYEALERLTPTSSLKDVIGGYASRMATLDFDNQSELQYKLTNQDPERVQRTRITDLIRRADDPTWLQPYAAALPMAFAYATHELVPTGTGAGRVVSVNLRGIVNPDRQSDWRARLVVVNDAGDERYSPLWSAGTQSVTLAANENTVFLTVAATPGEIVPTLITDAEQAYTSHPGRERFPYEVQLTGATAKGSGTGSSTMVVHSNGGGLKASTATVEAGAYVGTNARVLDYAVVRSGARVEDNAVVSGHALLRSGAVVRGNARVREYALLEFCDISDNARIGGHVWVRGGIVVRDNATVKGFGNLWSAGGGAYIGGDAVMDGDFQNGHTATNGFHFGWEWGGLQPNTIASKTAPPALFASYEFPTAHAYAAKDQYGATDGLLVGSPTWVSTDGVRKGFLTFNGSGQYVLLNRWVGDFRMGTFTTRVKWAGGPANQALFHFGDGTSNNQVYVTPSNASGVCELRVVKDGTSYSVPAATALPVGLWVRLSVVLDGSAAALYIDDALAGVTACPVRPEDVLPADTNETPAHCFIGSGTGLADLQGSVDDFKVYSVPITGSMGLTVEAITSTTTERGNPATFRIRRFGLDGASFAAPLTVNYTLSGTATAGIDYVLPSGSATIPANAETVDVVITPVPDNLTEPVETIIFTLAAGTGYEFASGASTGTAEITDSTRLDDNLLAWYRFDETSGSVANDSSALNNDATLVNGPVWTPGSLSFDGIDDYVQTPVANGGERTLSAWIFPRTSTVKGCVFDSDVPGQYGTGWRVTNGVIEVILDNQFWYTGVEVTHNQWQHVALAFDASTARVYLNGALAASLSYNRGSVTAVNYKIGRSNANPVEAFDGEIRDARIFARAVSDLEAADLFDGIISSPTVAPGSLTATPGSDSVQLSWLPANDGETRYFVGRATSPGGPYTYIGITTGTSFTDTGVPTGVPFYYIVQAANGSGPGPASNEVGIILSGSNTIPPPWREDNVGTAAGSPSTVFAGGQVTVNGAGARIRNRSTDSFRFVSIPVIGDCTITARVDALGSANSAAKAGVMIRQDLTDSALHASTLLSTANLHFLRRTSVGSNSAETTASLISQPWVRIVRAGTTFSSFWSADGQSWTQIGNNQTVPMSATAAYYVGLAVCSGSTTTLSNAAFSNVTITGGYPTGLAATAGNEQVALNWNAVTGATSYRVKRATDAGGPYTEISSPATNTFTDTGLSNGTTYFYVVSAHNGTAESANSTEAFATPVFVPSSLVWNNSVGTGIWSSADANWTGFPWQAGGQATISHTAIPETITLSEAATADVVAIGNGTNHGNYTLTGSSLAARTLRVQGDPASHLGINETAMLTDIDLSVTEDLVIGRANLVIGGNASVTAQRIGGTISDVANADWGQLTIQENADVTATAGIVGNSTAWGINLNGGTLTTTGIDFGPHVFVGSSNLNFNGTLVKAAADNPDFITTTGGDELAPVIQSGGALLDTNGHDIGIGKVLSGSGPLVKSGAGTLTLAAANTFTGPATVNAGALVVPTGGQIVNGNSLTVSSSSSHALVAVEGGSVTRNFIDVGRGTGTGVVRVTSGTLSSSGEIWLGSNATDAGFGVMNITGGSVSTRSWLALGRGAANSTQNTRGVLQMSNGTLNVGGGNLSIGAFQADTAATSLMSLSGGTVNVAGNVYVGEWLSGILDVSGGSITTAINGGVWLKLKGSTGTGILNLRGGSVTTGFVARPAAAGPGIVNFDGGTLRAKLDGIGFMQGLTQANVYPGNAIIDTNGFHITVAQALLAPAGNGVSAAGLGVSGTGYVAAPIVDITGGGGTGATAVATIDANGDLTGITITNPGTGYTSAPAFTLVGGGGSGSVTGTATLLPNTSGGLVKNGSGSLTLTATNTHGGGTTVNAGTLVASGSSATLGTGDLTVASGGTCALQNPNGAVADSASVFLTGSATLDLATGVAETVRFLHIDGILQAPGTYTAGNLPAHITGSGSLIVTEGTVVLTPAEIWRDQHFSTIANTGDAADDADPDADGFINLLERAFGLNPLAHDAAGSPFADPSEGNLAITFQHARAASDLVLSVEFCPDLDPAKWRAAVLAPQANADGTLELIDDTRPDVRIYRFTATSIAGRGFYRIRAEAGP